jgi:tetratricopeptide (TPR) repeat protein
MRVVPRPFWLLAVVWLPSAGDVNRFTPCDHPPAAGNPASTVNRAQQLDQNPKPTFEESAIRQVFEGYYAAYEARDVDRTVKFWHTQSGAYPAVQKRLAAFFPLQQYKFSNLSVTRIQRGVDEVTARVSVDVDVTTGGSTSRPERQRWIRSVILREEEGVWRIFRESDPIEALVRRLRRASSQDERMAMVAEDPELITPDLAREIEREVMVMGPGPEQALDWYRLMEYVARRAESPRFVGGALMGRARVHEGLKEPELAQDLYAQAIAVFEAANLPERVGEAEATIGTARLKRLDYRNAQLHFQAAVAAFQRAADKASEASALHSLGTCHFFEGEWDLALVRYRQSLSVQEGLLSTEGANASNLRRRGVASAYQAIGMVNQARGDYAGAADSYSESLRRFTELDDRTGTISASLDLARLFRRQDLSAKSLQQYLSALDVASRDDAAYRDLPRIAGIDREIAELLTNERRYGAALDYYQRSKDISDLASDPKGLSAALAGMGTVHYIQSRYDQALDFYAKSLTIRETLNDRPAIAWTVLNVGLAQSARRRHGEAIGSYTRSLELARALGNDALEAILVALVGRSQLGLGSLDEALASARKAESLAVENGDRDVLERAHLIAGAVHRRAGRLDEAAREIELAVQALDQLRVDRESGRAEEFFSDDEGPYVAKVELALDRHQLAEAFITAERMRLRRLREDVASSVQRGMTREEREAEATLGSRLTSLRRQHWRQSRQPNADKARTATLAEDLRALVAQRDGFQAALSARHPELSVLRAQVEPLSLDGVSKMIPDARTAVLQFLVTEDRTYLFVFAAGAATVAEAGEGLRQAVAVVTIETSAPELARRVSRFRESIRRPDSRLDNAGRDLFDLLLAPIGAQLQGRNRLIILPDATLWALPFQALQTANGHFLIEDFTVEYSPSLSALSAVRGLKNTRARVATSGNAAMAFGAYPRGVTSAFAGWATAGQPSRVIWPARPKLN